MGNVAILTDMAASDIVSQIIEILTSGITSFAQGIGTGIAASAKAMAFNSDGTAFNVFFILVLVFAGVSLCVGITTLLFNWLSGLGSR